MSDHHPAALFHFMRRLRNLAWDEHRLIILHNNAEAMGDFPRYHCTNVELVSWANDVLDYAKFRQ